MKSSRQNSKASARRMARRPEPTLSTKTMTAAEQSAMRYGGRLERRATRDFIRRERGDRSNGLQFDQGYRAGLDAVAAFLGGRIQRTRKAGGLGR